MILRTLSIGVVVGLGLAALLVLTGEQEPRTVAGKTSSTAAVVTEQPRTRIPLRVARASNPPWDFNNGWLSDRPPTARGGRGTVALEGTGWWPAAVSRIGLSGRTPAD
jgi:hypothetical protein